MGMFSRMSDIVQANINAMLDKAEDPEKVIRLIIQEMEETLVEMRSVAAKYLAEEKYLDRQAEKLQKDVDGWMAKAELAMDKGKDELARAALVQKNAFSDKLAAIESQKVQLTEMLSGIQEDTGRLHAKLAEARQKQKSLVARKQNAGVRLKARSVTHSEQIESAMARFDSYEQRIEHLEAQVDAYDVTDGSGQSLEAQFKALETSDAIDAELAAMKKKRAA
ncbi:phage shock protein PspA [Alteromonas sp. RKMC-009]|uniref:phage shock protein PspA n=1 Tax=Alteromonas sp. RKMC-009 TaxID=2267264 RepID=UPI000E6A488E|nr:phage shock protein PspA [Alteromonas sp. RKMC-009]AYA65665.1 phage shock protein PspA [Alteromonas sp. RKMC-009]MEC7690367.1 phage shock protein PspA [Pseudomonadota bacterium]